MGVRDQKLAARFLIAAVLLMVTDVSATYSVNSSAFLDRLKDAPVRIFAGKSQGNWGDPSGYISAPSSACWKDFHTMYLIYNPINEFFVAKMSADTKEFEVVFGKVHPKRLIGHHDNATDLDSYANCAFTDSYFVFKLDKKLYRMNTDPAAANYHKPHPYPINTPHISWGRIVDIKYEPVTRTLWVLGTLNAMYIQSRNSSWVKHTLTSSKSIGRFALPPPTHSR